MNIHIRMIIDAHFISSHELMLSEEYFFFIVKPNKNQKSNSKSIRFNWILSICNPFITNCNKIVCPATSLRLEFRLVISLFVQFPLYFKRHINTGNLYVKVGRWQTWGENRHNRRAEHKTIQQTDIR